jgi:hypothetical protein
MPETIRAKFRCEQVTKHKDWRNKQEFIYDASFQPVTGGGQENESFFAATPSGNINLQSYVSDQFVPGKEYYVDFTPALPEQG